MKKFKTIMTFCIVVVFVLTACSSQSQSDKTAFDAQLTRVADKEKAFNQTLDDMALYKLKDIGQGDTTDESKKVFQAFDTKIKKQLKPKFQAYNKAVQQLPASNDDLKSVKQAYVKGMKGKEKEIQRLEDFVTQCIASIEANENILNDTQAFESHRGHVEAYIAEAHATAEGAEESAALEEMLESQNDKIKTSAEEAAGHNDDGKEAQVYRDETIPLIQQQIKALNQKQLHNNAVSQARQSAIEMYYDLERYYETRVKTIEYSQALAKIDVNHLVTSSEQLEHYNDSFQQKYDAL